MNRTYLSSCEGLNDSSCLVQKEFRIKKVNPSPPNVDPAEWRVEGASDGRRCRFHAFHFRKCEPIGANRDEGFVSAVQPRKRTRSGGASTSTA